MKKNQLQVRKVMETAYITVLQGTATQETDQLLF